jgi:hypothetical protein
MNYPTEIVRLFNHKRNRIAKLIAITSWKTKGWSLISYLIS